MAPAAKRRDWLPVIGFWALLSALLLAQAALKPGGMLISSDHAMRMVMVDQLLEGQAWQDQTSLRDNAPHGASMHWSRVIDAPIAALVLLARPIAGSAAPEVAAALWPILLLLPLLALCVSITRHLAPEAGVMTALALPLVSIVLVVEFLPGRVDHHNAQMLLSLVAAWALLLHRERTGGAAIAALASSTSLAIGMEAIPFVAATIAAYGLLWLTDPERYRVPLAAFGTILGLSTALHFIAATAPASYADAACDMLSVAYVVPSLCGAAGLAAIALLLSNLRIWSRALALICGGGVTALLFGTMFPQCLAGPYAMEQLLEIPGYFELILEARPLFAAFAENPINAIVYAAAVLVALPLTIWVAVTARGTRRTDWLILLGFLLSACAVMVLQLRGVRFAALYSLPAGAWLIARARAYYLDHRGAAGAGLMIGSWVLMSSAAHFGILAVTAMLMPRAAYANVVFERLAEREACILGDAYDRLAALPDGRVMAPFNLGPNILFYSPHEIVSAGFHRNIEGTKDVVAFFSGDEATARRVAVKRAVDYVAVCPGGESYDGPVGPAGGEHWSWLQPLSVPGEALQVYRVRL